jgi:hypothetical protein
VAAEVPVEIERADAAVWVDDVLAEPARGVATVVYHSVVWQYLGAAVQAALERTIRDAGARATADAPLAWLRFEPHREPVRGVDLRLTSWPGGADRSLAMSGYHGEWVRWGPAPD